MGCVIECVRHCTSALVRTNLMSPALLPFVGTSMALITAPLGAVRLPTVPARACVPKAFLWDDFDLDSAFNRPALRLPSIGFANDGKGGSVQAKEEATAEDDSLLPWQLAMLGITACWGANFPVTTYALDALDGATDGELFIASRFVVGTSVLVPFLASASTAASVVAGVQVGALCAFGYATQAASLALGTCPGTAAFICSLQSVVVALTSAWLAQRDGSNKGVAPQTWAAVALSVAGVGCLELPSASGGLCLGDVLALGQPIGFGLSYVVLEDAMARFPDDELPLAALQCAVVAMAAVATAAAGAHAAPWDLPWDHMLPAALPAVGPDAAATAAAWGVPLAIAYTGVISTALTIWLTAKVFKRLPSTDASIILASEPLWATAFAAALLHEPFGPMSCAGGALILGALACNQGAFDAMVPGWQAEDAN